MANDIIRQIDNDVEFFTVQATGESGMSKSGLAKLCGVKPNAIGQLLKTVGTSSCHEFLKPLQDKALTLVTSSEYKNADILKDEVCAIVLEWYAFESQRTKEAARYSYRRFAKLGIRSWIQSITGWQEKDPTIAIYETHQKQCHQQFLLDTHRVELRNQLKTYRKGLNSTIKQHFEELGRKVPRDAYWKVADALNVALTSETARQMRKRTGLESHQLLADYMAERPLWFYSLAITVTTNLILHEDVEPLIAVAKAPSLSLPKDFFAEPVEIVDPIKALEKRIDLYLSGQLSLPVFGGKMLAIA